MITDIETLRQGLVVINDEVNPVNVPHDFVAEGETPLLMFYVTIQTKSAGDNGDAQN
ncbi:MAG: hypothetical protein ACE5H9_05730 [Anaerolineae bacterium]